jgi:hypothetical protein
VFPGRRRNAGGGNLLHFMHYNFARLDMTLRLTLATEAGLAD